MNLEFDLMSKYRSRIDIIAAILNVARQGVCKTRIMYIANLSYRLLEKYLKETVELGFLGFDNSGYRVTDKGLAFLEKYVNFSDKYSRIESERQKMLFEKETLEKLCQPNSASVQSSTQRRRLR